MKNSKLYYPDEMSNGVRLCKSKYRDIPINKKYFYKVIATKYNGEKIISYSPDINETELKSLNAKN